MKKVFYFLSLFLVSSVIFTGCFNPDDSDSGGKSYSYSNFYFYDADSTFDGEMPENSYVTYIDENRNKNKIDVSGKKYSTNVKYEFQFDKESNYFCLNVWFDTEISGENKVFIKNNRTFIGTYSGNPTENGLVKCHVSSSKRSDETTVCSKGWKYFECSKIVISEAAAENVSGNFECTVDDEVLTFAGMEFLYKDEEESCYF